MFCNTVPFVFDSIRTNAFFAFRARLPNGVTLSSAAELWVTCSLAAQLPVLTDADSVAFNFFCFVLWLCFAAVPSCRLASLNIHITSVTCWWLSNMVTSQWSVSVVSGRVLSHSKAWTCKCVSHATFLKQCNYFSQISSLMPSMIHSLGQSVNWIQVF